MSSIVVVFSILDIKKVSFRWGRTFKVVRYFHAEHMGRTHIRSRIDRLTSGRTPEGTAQLASCLASPGVVGQ